MDWCLEIQLEPDWFIWFWLPDQPAAGIVDRKTSGGINGWCGFVKNARLDEFQREFCCVLDDGIWVGLVVTQPTCRTFDQPLPIIRHHPPGTGRCLLPLMINKWCGIDKIGWQEEIWNDL